MQTENLIYVTFEFRVKKSAKLKEGSRWVKI